MMQNNILNVLNVLNAGSVSEEEEVTFASLFASRGYIDMDPRNLVAVTHYTGVDIFEYPNALGTPPATQPGASGVQPNYVSSYAPFGGLPAVNPVGSSGAYMTFGDAYDGQQSGTAVQLSWFIVGKCDTLSGYQIFVGKSNASASQRQLYFGFRDAGKMVAYTSPIGSGFGGREIVTDNVVADTTDPHLFEYHVDGTITTNNGEDAIEFFMDGTEITAKGSSGSGTYTGDIVNSTTELGLFTLAGNAPATYFDGRAGRMCAFAGKLTDAEKLIIRTHLINEWSL